MACIFLQFIFMSRSSAECIKLEFCGSTDIIILTYHFENCYYNNNNNHDNVYGAVIITKVIERVHLVHLMNVGWVLNGRQPSDQANWPGLRIRRKLAATVHIHCRHCYYYSACKADSHFTIPRRVESWDDLSTVVKVHSPCPRLYIMRLSR